MQEVSHFQAQCTRRASASASGIYIIYIIAVRPISTFVGSYIRDEKLTKMFNMQCAEWRSRTSFGWRLWVFAACRAATVKETDILLLLLLLWLHAKRSMTTSPPYNGYVMFVNNATCIWFFAKFISFLFFCYVYFGFLLLSAANLRTFCKLELYN